MIDDKSKIQKLCGLVNVELASCNSTSDFWETKQTPRIIIIIIIIIITLFESQIILAEHECCTNWGDCKSNKSNQIKSNVGF